MNSSRKQKYPNSSNTTNKETAPMRNETYNIEEELSHSLAIFDFSAPLVEKTKDTLRLFYNNCNGVEINQVIESLLQQERDKKKFNYLQDIEIPTKLDGLLRQMKAWSVDIVSLSEFCVAWEDHVPRRAVQRLTQKYEANGCWTVSSSNIKVGSYYKPGGTGTLAMDNCNGKIKERGSDPWGMGRWSYILLSGKSNRNLLVITGYRTGNRSGEIGQKTAWMQQQTMLINKKRTEPPHAAFLLDLTKWIQELPHMEVEIMLCLDANEQWGPKAEIRNFADNLNLINVNQVMDFSSTHPNLANSTRSTTIDYCLCSEGLLDYIGYASLVPYDLEVLGDHRGFVVDINARKFFGDNEMDNSISKRKLIMSNPKAVEAYLQIVDDKFTKQNIYDRCKQLIQRVNKGDTDIANIMLKYERLDREIHGICTKAEKGCRPAWAGSFEWSPKLVYAIKTLTYWRHRMKYKDRTVVAKQLEKELNLIYQPLSQEVIQQMVTTSRQLLSDIQQTSREHRQEHLEALAENYASQHNMTSQQAVIDLMSHEDSRSTFEMLRQRLKPMTRRQLKTLWIARDEEGNYIKDITSKTVLTDKDDIHEALLRRNEKHLHQAAQTPFAHGKLRRRLRWDGTGVIAENMLTGEILNERKFSSAMQLYLESIKVQDFKLLNIVRPTLTLEEYSDFWKKKRESTVTSPFGLHIGHYKAALHKPAILEVHRVLLLIPFKTSMVPVRWRRTVQTMLEKDPGSPWIHRLRIIELFDAQANAGFQIFVGRTMMRNALSKNLLRDESYGSTPGKMAASALVQKLLSIDQLRLERRAGGIFDCDASGCYDRILPPLASVHLQALGLHHTIGTFLARIMFLAHRYVKTGHGISTQNIRTTNAHTLHGIGQGNGGGPAMWIAHLTVMFSALSAVCWGFVFTCVQQVSRVTSVGTGYVDDVTLGLSVSDNQPQTEHTVHKQIHRMGQLWEKLLYISGGRLELSKCFWVPITWKWKKGKPTCNTKNSRSKELELCESETGDSIRIPKLKSNVAEKRLGVWSNCESTWKREYQNWIEFSTGFGRKVKHARLGRTAGYLAYHSLWLAKFRYSAPVIGFSISQLKALQAKVTGPCLSASGYSNKMPRDVVYGPTQYGGMAWDAVELVSLHEKLKMVIGSIRLQDTVGQMMAIQLSWLQLFSGIGIPLFQASTEIPYLPKGWMSMIHQQLVYYGIQVELSSGWLPTIQRANDRVIMDIVVRSLPQWTWGGINRCRLFVKATTLTDITTRDGKFIPSKIRLVKGPMRNNMVKFPFQTRPGKRDIEHWEYFLDSIACNGHLHVTLGHWTRYPDQVFPFMKHGHDNIVYKHSPQGWSVYCPRTPSNRRLMRQNTVVPMIPKHCHPVRVIEATNYIVFMEDNLGCPVELHPKDWYRERQIQMEETVRGKYTVDSQLLLELEQKWHSPDTVIVGATDGGLKEHIGTSSYAIFLTGTDAPVISGYAGEYQPRNDASSTRQELLGQLGLEYWLKELRLRWGIPRNALKVTLVTDSQASLDIMNNMVHTGGIREMLRPEMDVALELQRERDDKWWIHWNFQKVTSHIQLHEAPNEFYWLCNDIADVLASRAREEWSVDQLKGQPSFAFRGTKAVCRINGRLENNNIYRKLTEEINGANLQLYLMERYNWTEKEFNQIAWSAHQREIGRIPRYKQVTLYKYIHGWLATNKRRSRERASIPAQCLFCGHEENRTHIFVCAHAQLRRIREQRKNKLLTQICDGIDPACAAVFTAGLNTVFGSSAPAERTKQDWPSRLQESYDTQEGIGWINVLYGRMAGQWEQMAEYNGAVVHGSDKFVWTGKVIRLSWDFGLDLWKIRNQMVHGNGTGPSLGEQNRVSAIITAMYRDLLPRVTYRTNEIFSKTEVEMQNLPYQSQVAWIERLKFLFPIDFMEIEQSSALDIRREIDLETRINKWETTHLSRDSTASHGE